MRRVTKNDRVTACDSESLKFSDWRPRKAFLSGFLVTRCHTVTPKRNRANSKDRGKEA